MQTEVKYTLLLLLVQFFLVFVTEIPVLVQDQAIAIVTEVCEANQSKPFLPETESLCLLMLQILEKSLYLELCVSQSCGIRPVLGRIEDFSKRIKLLMRGTSSSYSFVFQMFLCDMILFIFKFFCTHELLMFPVFYT